MDIDILHDKKANIISNFNQKNILLTHIEDLSNEIFYEIFEYLECYDLFNGFSNLNSRFENLIHCSSLQLRINIDFASKSDVQHHCKQYLIPNKYRIVSLYLCDRSSINISTLLCTLDSSFNRLKSLILEHVQYNKLISLFPILSSLPHLISISIQLTNEFVNLTEIYRLIFLLPFLKKSEISVTGFSSNILLPINTIDQYSSIKRLIINYSCSLTELITLLSYIPEVRYLICQELSKCNEHIARNLSIKISHLTNIMFNICFVHFDEFEIFIRKICSQVRVLCINTSQDDAYLDADRWERLIVQYVPYLHKFEFNYQDCYYQTIEMSSYHLLIDRFTSSFWTNRGWVFQLTTDLDYWPPIKIIYSIYSTREKRYEQSVNVKLIISRLYFAASRELLVDDIFSFIGNLQITSVDVDCKKLAFRKFIQLLLTLPNLNSLKVLSLSSFKLECLSDKDAELVDLFSRNNKITKLELECFTEETQLKIIQFYINLCPRIEYLQVKCESNLNIKSIVWDILLKDVGKIFYLCLWIPIANDQMIKQLQTMINLEKLIHDYKIKRTSDRMYLQWKRH